MTCQLRVCWVEHSCTQHVQVPGFMHPVQRFYLEDVLETIRQVSITCVILELLYRGESVQVSTLKDLCLPVCSTLTMEHRCSSPKLPAESDSRHACRYSLPHKQPAGQNGHAQDPEYAAEVDAAIQAAFLSGTDEDFDYLLEVGGRLLLCDRLQPMLSSPQAFSSPV